MGGSVDKGAGEGSREEVSESILSKEFSQRFDLDAITTPDTTVVHGMQVMMGGTYTLLEDTGHQTTSLLRTILKGSGGGISVETTHRNAEERATGEEL